MKMVEASERKRLLDELLLRTEHGRDVVIARIDINNRGWLNYHSQTFNPLPPEKIHDMLCNRINEIVDKLLLDEKARRIFNGAVIGTFGITITATENEITYLIGHIRLILEAQDGKSHHSTLDDDCNKPYTIYTVH